MKLNKLKINPKNPRVIKDEAFENLKKSITENPTFMELRPIVIDEDNIILGGNQRYKACCELFKERNEIPDDWVKQVNDLSDEQKKKFLLLDNSPKGYSGDWDIDLLKDIILDIPEFDLLDDFDIDFTETTTSSSEEDFEIILPKEPKSKRGEIYQLGRHRIMCGDSTKKEDVEKLMDGEKACMAFNDPPYGMKKEKEGVLNDNLNFAKLLEFNRDWITLQFAHIKENGSWYCWGTDEPLMDIYSQIIKPYILKQKATFRNLITWNKGHGQGQNSENTRSYAIADEKCLFVMCGVQGFNNNADNYFEGWEPIRGYLLEQRLKCGWDIPTMKRIAGHSNLSSDHWTCKSQWNMPTKGVYTCFQNWAKENKADAFQKEYEELKKEYYSTRAYFNNTHDNFNNVWNIERAGNQERETTGNHATPKPIELCSRGIKSSSPVDGIVQDAFLGSGSTLIACEKTNRICYGMELDPIYIDVIIDRWENFTEKEAVRLSDNKKWNEINK